MMKSPNGSIKNGILKNDSVTPLLLKNKENSIRDEDEKKKEKEPASPKVSITKLWRYSSKFDLFLIILGSLVAIITGLGFPFMSIVIGNISGGFINVTRLKNDPTGLIKLNNESWVPFETTYSMDTFSHDVHKNCLEYVYIGTIVLVAAFLQVTCFLVSGENNSHRMRRKFFRALLRQDISCNLERIKEGTGDKVALLLQMLGQFFGGFVIAFRYDWKLTLIMMSLSPFMIICGAFMAKLMATTAAKEAEKYAKAGAIAEEALTSIRTVVAFNGVSRECERYDKALEAGKKDGIIKG
uniref:ABC transmembrane type-1 domain-containing protein n=1 Tax=Acrobeloides nanus TaxID=290746 RepID=A0A914CXP8_9BILA